jgi:pimeloyl-ACP methyl ester carboxylesterase
MKLFAAALLCAAAQAATVDGIPLHYTATGKGAKTIVLVHGWTCNETSWSGQVPALAKQYRVVTVDLPGHGKSGSPPEGKWSMDLFARAVESVRAEVKADRVTLVGHSMGTPVIVQYARLYPDRVTALVFVDGVLTMNPRGLNTQMFMGEDGRKNREKMVRGMFSGASTPEVQSKILAMMLGAPEATAVGAMTAMLDPAIWKGDVISLPILGLYADKSALGNREYVEKHYPKMEYTEISGTGHFLMLEKPDEFNRRLLEFLKTQ